MLNYAKSFFQDENKAIGDELNKMREYGKFLDDLFIVIHTFKRHNFRPIKISDNVSVIPSNGRNRPSSFYNIIKICSALCSQYTIDIINAQEPYYTGLIGVYLKRKYGCKLITAVLGSNVYDKAWLRESKLNFVKGAIGRLVLKYSDFIQVDGSKTESDLRKSGISPKKIFKKIVIPKGLDDFASGKGYQVQKQVLDRKSEKVLLFVGRIEKQKNLIGLLSIMPDIFKLNPKVLLLIIGDGREKPKLERLAKKLEIERNILFLGNVPFNKLPDYYHASDIFLLPSHYEGFARVLMLAGISGKAVVSTNVSGASDLIKDGISGFIVDIGDMRSFRDRVLELLSNNERLEEFGKNIQKNTRSLPDFDRMVEIQIKFWKYAYSE